VICEAPASVVPAVHAGRRTVAVRVPDHVVARALAEACGSPVTATSANRSGEPPARTADALADVVDARVLIVDGGSTPGGRPSTIVDARGSQPVCVREGAVAWDRVVHSLHS
jgi:L-threonylcarbamoyladenylate synthase